MSFFGFFNRKHKALAERTVDDIAGQEAMLRRANVTKFEAVCEELGDVACDDSLETSSAHAQDATERSHRKYKAIAERTVDDIAGQEAVLRRANVAKFEAASEDLTEAGCADSCEASSTSAQDAAGEVTR